MLTKIIGALMVTAATTSLGLMSARQLKRRVRSLRSLVGALDIMRSEICTRLTPMPELLELLAAQSGEPANIFFANCLIKQRSMRGRPFVELWLSALKSTQELELNENELEPLTELGSALGRSTQTDRASYTRRRKRLEAFLQKAREGTGEQDKDNAGHSRRSDDNNHFDLEVFSMDVTLIFKIAAVGIMVTIVNILLSKSGRDEYGLFVNLLGLTIVILRIAPEIKNLFGVIRSLFNL